jgi:hypothetical protein
MVTTSTGWALILAGAIMAAIFGMATYGYLGPIPTPLDTVCMILFGVGLILLIIGIILVVVLVVRKATGT